MTGRDGITAHALPHDRLLETMARFGRPARPADAGELTGGARTGRRSGRRPRTTSPPIRAILAAHGNDGPVVVADIVGPYLRHLLAARARPGRGRGRRGRRLRGDDRHRPVGPPRRPLRPAGPARPGHRPAAARGRVRRRRPADDVRLRRPARRCRSTSGPGCAPLWPSLYVEGPADRLPAPPAAISTRDATADELAATRADVERPRPDGDLGSLDGAGRPPTTSSSSMAGRSSRSASARVRQASTLRVLDRLVVHPDGGVDPVPRDARGHRADPVGGGEVVAAIQGPSPVLRPLLDLGFRIADRDQFMASRRRTCSIRPGSSPATPGCSVRERLRAPSRGDPAVRPGRRPASRSARRPCCPTRSRAVVVADALVAEQLVEHEPRVARALADPAVGDDVLVGRDALGLVEVARARRGS